LKIFHPRLEFEASYLENDVDALMMSGFTGRQEVIFLNSNNYSDFEFFESQPFTPPYIGGCIGVVLIETDINNLTPSAILQMPTFLNNEAYLTGHIAAGLTFNIGR